jgi:antirestriction protein ArdC
MDEAHKQGTDAAEARVKPQRDLRQEIADRMVESLEHGQIPWERPWENLEHGLARNMVSGQPYRGGNRMLLMLHQMDQGYADPRFGTIKQINELGGRVNKGEKGYQVELWKDQPFWERRDVDVTLNKMRVKVFEEGKGVVHAGMPTDKAPTLVVKPSELTVLHKGQELTWGQAHKELDSVVGRVYTVFNAEQCTGLKIEPLKAPDNKIPVVDRGEQVMQAMRGDGLNFATHPQQAFYSPKRDEVSLPPRESFKSVEGYYGTALHEIGHATGAQQRLNREGITGGHRFGSEGYAKEELRAELFSTFMAAETGIPHDEEQHKAYIQSWAKALKEDKNEIFRAASEAGKAVDYVLAKEQALRITQERQASVEVAERAAAAEQQTEPAQGKLHSVDGGPTPNAGKSPKNQPTLREALESSGWKATPHGSYEKTFLLDKDKSKGGEFTGGKGTVEKILIAKPHPVGFVIAHGWEDKPVYLRGGLSPTERVAGLEQSAKQLLMDEHGKSLGVTAIRGKGDPEVQPAPAPSAPDTMQEAIRREDALLSKQPHELTFAEFATVATAQKLGPGHGREWEVFDGSAQRGESLGFAEGPTANDALRMAHKREVNNALYDHTPDAFRPPGMEPKSMPPRHVLDEYPDLQEKFAPTIKEHRQMLDKEDRKASEYQVMTAEPSAYEKAVQNFVANGGKEMEARRLLDSEMAGDVSANGLADALAFHCFADAVSADKLAADILTEENRKVLAKEDRKESEYQAMKQADAPARSMFWRKVSDIEDICDDVVNLPGAGPQASFPVKIIDAQALTVEDYDAFAADFFKSQPWLEGKGGEEDDGTRHVVEVTAVDRQTLHINPSGHDYARYVGIPDTDVQRVMEQRSLVVSGHDQVGVSSVRDTPTQPLQAAIAERTDIPRHINGRAALPDDRREAADARLARLDPITDAALFRVGQGRGTEEHHAYLDRVGLLDAEGGLSQATADMICVQAAIREEALTEAYGPAATAQQLRGDDVGLKAGDDRSPAQAAPPDRKPPPDSRHQRSHRSISAER